MTPEQFKKQWNCSKICGRINIIIIITIDEIFDLSWSLEPMIRQYLFAESMRRNIAREVKLALLGSNGECCQRDMLPNN